MKIFFVTALNTGCSKWRAEIPAKYLRKRGHTVTFFDHWLGAECPDVVVFCRQYQFDLFRLYNWAKDRGIRVVYETDDALDLVDPWNPAYEFAQKHRAESEAMARDADVVTTTTPELANRLRKLNPNVVVIPNSIDPEEWRVEPRCLREKLRLGWLGSSTHFLDLAVAADAISELRRKRDFTFVIYGLTDLPSVEEMYRQRMKKFGVSFVNSHLGKAIKVFLRKTDRLPYEFHPYVPPSEYAAKLSSIRFDIGIAPLADTAFNRSKSCIKYYEYTMSGAVTLASNVLPYSTEVPHVCDNTRRAWKEALEELMDSDLEGLGQQHYEWILANRNIERNVTLWEDALMGAAVPASVIG